MRLSYGMAKAKVTTKMVNVRMPVDMLDAVDELAEGDGSSRSAVIMGAVQARIDGRIRKPPIPPIDASERQRLLFDRQQKLNASKGK